MHPIWLFAGPGREAPENIAAVEETVFPYFDTTALSLRKTVFLYLTMNQSEEYYTPFHCCTSLGLISQQVRKLGISKIKKSQ